MSAAPPPAGSLARALRRGVALAAPAALCLGLWDSACVILARQASFDSLQEIVAYAIGGSLAPLLLAAPLGAALGLWLWLLDRCARGAAALAPRLLRARAVALLCALSAAPYLAWVSAQLFQGPRASRVPHHQLISVALCGAALVALVLLVPPLLRLLASAEAAPRRGAALVLWGLALVCSVADQRVLPRLYPFFHVSLLLLSVGATLLALQLALARRLADAKVSDRAVLAGLILMMLLGSGGHLLLHHTPGARARALESSTIAGRALALTGALAPRPTAPPAAPDGRSAASAASIDEEDALPPGSGPRLAAPERPDPDVYLITVDALRADHLDDARMPVAASLARRGVRFQRAYTQAPHTSFAIATLLTGKPVYALLGLGQDASQHETLPLVLRQVRYKTAAFYPPAVFYIERERLKRLEEMAYGFEYVKYEYLDGLRRTDQVLDFFARERPAKAFVWIHYFEPHEPYEVHPGGPPASADDAARYAGEARFVDQQLERLLNHARLRGRPALFVLAADHGEEFGEHGGRYHGTTLYEEQVRVPLFFTYLPGQAGGLQPLPPQVIEQPVGLIDVAPTLLWLLDVVPSLRMSGRDLGPWLRGAPPGQPRRALPRWPVFADLGRKKMVVQGDDKLLCDLSQDLCALYDLQKDPGEQRDLSQRGAAFAPRVQRLRAALDRYLTEASRFELAAQVPAEAALDGEAQKALLRGRLEDRAAAPALLRLADSGAPAVRREALLLLAQLCASAPLVGAPTQAAPARCGLAAEESALLPLLREAATSAEVAASGGADAGLPADGGVSTSPRALQRWATLALLRVEAVTLDRQGERRMLSEAADLLRDPAVEPKLRAAAALTLASRLPRPASPPPAGRPPRAAAGADSLDLVLLLGQSLPQLLAQDDPERVRPILLALGRSRDPRALVPLVGLLDNVRSRADLVAALGLLGDRRATPALRLRLLGDPYVPVRAAAAAALGQLGGPEAQAALTQAARSEREAPVQQALAAALRQSPSQ